MVLTWTHGIELVIMNHTRTRGPSVTRRRDFLEGVQHFFLRGVHFFLHSREKILMGQINLFITFLNFFGGEGSEYIYIYIFYFFGGQ